MIVKENKKVLTKLYLYSVLVELVLYIINVLVVYIIKIKAQNKEIENIAYCPLNKKPHLTKQRSL